MIRILIILALAYGVYWCYNNIDFNNVKSSTIETIKKEKTIKAVNQTRSDLAEDAEEAMNY